MLARVKTHNASGCLRIPAPRIMCLGRFALNSSSWWFVGFIVPDAQVHYPHILSPEHWRPHTGRPSRLFAKSFEIETQAQRIQTTSVTSSSGEPRHNHLVLPVASVHKMDKRPGPASSRTIRAIILMRYMFLYRVPLQVGIGMVHLN